MDAGTRFARVLASALWGAVAAGLLRWFGLTFGLEQAEAFQAGLIVVLAPVINAVIALLSKRYPWVEWLLFVNSRPVYMNTAQEKIVRKVIERS